MERKIIRHSTHPIGGGWSATLELIEEGADGRRVGHFALGPGPGPFFSFAPYGDGETLASLVLRWDGREAATVELPWIENDPHQTRALADAAAGGRLGDVLEAALGPTLLPR